MFDYQYSFYRLGNQYWRITRYPLRIGSDLKSESQHYDNKLQSSISRSRRRIFELALCNPWQYFFTGTLDKSKYDRFDLDSFHKDLTLFCRQRGIKFLFVPECHSDGAWHIHGLVNGVSSSDVRPFSSYPPSFSLPSSLRNSDYFDFLPYRYKFGFVSLGAVQSPIAVSFYVTKYITKSLALNNLGLHSRLYYNSRGLNSSEEVFSKIGYDPDIESYLSECEGFGMVASGLVRADWTFPFNFDDSIVRDLDVDYKLYEDYVDNYSEVSQCVINGF